MCEFIQSLRCRVLLVVVGMAALAHAGMATARSQGYAEPGTDKVGKADPAPSKVRTDQHGDLLPPGTLMRLGTSRFRHAGTIYSMAYSADGRLLATGNAGHQTILDDASVVVWDADTGRPIRTWFGHAHVVRSVAFSPDNKQIAVVNGYGKLRLYDLASGKELRRLETKSPAAALFTPDGSTLLVADVENLRRWDPVTGKELPPLRHKQSINALTVAADGKTIASSSMDGTVRVWDSEGRERHCLLIPKKYGLGLALSPDGKRLACGTYENEIHVWDTETGRECWRVKTEAWRVTAQSFSPDGKALVTGGDKLTWWDVASGKAVRVIDRPNGTVHLAAFSPDRKRIASAGNDAAPRFWDPADGTEILRYEGHRHAVVSGAFTPDGKSLATVSGEPFVHLWDTTTGKASHVASGHGDVHSAAFAPNGKTLVTSSSRTWPAAWELSTGKLLRRFESKDSDMPGGTVQFSADGKTLAASTGSVGIRLWDAATGQEQPVMYRGKTEMVGYDSGQFPRFVLSPEGKSVAATRSRNPESGTIRWDVATGEKRLPDSKAIGRLIIIGSADDSQDKKHLQLAQRGAPAAFSPDGRLVAIVDGKEVRLVDAATGLVLRRMQGDGLPVTCAAFSPDGKTLASAGDGKVVHLWETVTGERRELFKGHQGRIHFVAFSPDGRRLASGGEDHTALIWDLTGGATQVALTEKDCAALWTALADADAAKAYRALWTLAGDAEQAVAFLKSRLAPVDAADKQRLARLLADLDSEVFDVRRQASLDLEQLAELAIPALRHALSGKPSLELRRRVQGLLHDLYLQAPPAARLRLLRSIEVLEQVGTPAARQVLDRLAQGAPEVRSTQDARAALARLQAMPADKQTKAPTDQHGDLLPDGAVARLGTVRFRHGKYVFSALFSADGKTLISAGADAAIRIWEIPTGKELRRLDGHQGWIRALALSPDGKMLASGGSWLDHSLRLWDLETGKELRCLDKKHGEIVYLAFAPDGKSLYSATGSEIRVWDVAAGKVVRSVKPLAELAYDFTSVDFSPDGLKIATANIDGNRTQRFGGADPRGTLRLLDSGSGKELRKLQWSDKSVGPVAFSPDGRMLAIQVNPHILVWTADLDRELLRIGMPADGYSQLAFSPDSKTLAAIAANHTEMGQRTIHLWELATGKEILALPGHAASTRALVFSPDGNTLATGCDDRSIRLWNVVTGKEITRPMGPSGSLLRVSFRPDGKTLATVGMDQVVRLWDAASGKQLHQWRGDPSEVLAVCFSPDGKILAGGCLDGTVRLWDSASIKELCRFQLQDCVHALAFSPDGKLLAAGGSGHSLLWDVATGRWLDDDWLQPFDKTITTLAFSPDGRLLASAGLEKEITLWDLARKKPLRRIYLPVEREVWNLAFSPDSKTLLSGSSARSGSGERTIQLWEVATAKERRRFKRSAGKTDCDFAYVTFSPDGKRIVATGDRSFCIWDTFTGEEIREVTGHSGRISHASWSRDGKRLATVSGDTTGLIWDMASLAEDVPGREIFLAKGELERLWNALIDNDAQLACDAMETLIHAPRQAVTFLSERLRPVPHVNAQRIAVLLGDLNDDRFAVRAEATDELQKLRESAEPALRKALQGALGLEARRRIERLLEAIEELPLPVASLRVLRCIEVLERINSAQARAVLTTLAGGAPDMQLAREAKAAVERLKQVSAR